MGKVAEEIQLGARIAEARDLAGMTQAQVASKTGLGRTVIAKIEKGTRKLGAAELVTLAATLDRPVDWFFVPSPPAVVSRRSDSLVGGRSRILDTRVERIARDIDFLSGEQELPQVTRPELSPPLNLEEAEQAATSLRKLLGAVDGPLTNLLAHAERAGLFAFSLDLGRDGGDAAYVAVGDVGVAVVNGVLDPGRRRFNLAHELGHHVFMDEYAPEVGLSPHDEREKLINAFAIHLLLPRRDVNALVSEFGARNRLAAVAAAFRYRLSWTAVCTQFRTVDAVDAGAYEDLVNEPPSAEDSKELGEHWMPELDPPSVPPQYQQKVLAAYRRGKLTAARATELLWGTVDRTGLPTQNDIPLEAYRRAFELEA